jgi:hypothetical protein
MSRGASREFGRGSPGEQALRAGEPLKGRPPSTRSRSWAIVCAIAPRASSGSGSRIVSATSRTRCAGDALEQVSRTHLKARVCSDLRRRALFVCCRGSTRCHVSSRIVVHSFKETGRRLTCTRPSSTSTDWRNQGNYSHAVGTRPTGGGMGSCASRMRRSPRTLGVPAAVEQLVHGAVPTHQRRAALLLCQRSCLALKVSTGPPDLPRRGWVLAVAPPASYACCEPREWVIRRPAFVKESASRYPRDGGSVQASGNACSTQPVAAEVTEDCTGGVPRFPRGPRA